MPQNPIMQRWCDIHRGFATQQATTPGRRCVAVEQKARIVAQQASTSSR